MEIQLESKLTMVYVQVLRTVLAHGPITAGSPLPLFHLKTDPSYEELFVFQSEKATMFKISVMTKAWKCPNFVSGHGQLLAVGIRNLLDSGNRQLLALETGQLLASGNGHLSAFGTTEFFLWNNTSSGLRYQLLASGTSFLLLQSYLLLETVTLF